MHDLEIAARLTERARAGRTSVLMPETAATCAKALRLLAKAPTHDEMQAALCRKFREGKCKDRGATGCMTCTGQANAAMNAFGWPWVR